jgi:hypothetical protein
MKRLLFIALSVVSFSGRSVASDATSDAESQKPIKLERVTVTASRLDLSPDPLVDYIGPQQQLVFEYLGHDVPGNAIMQAEDLQDLKDNWRPTYRSLDEFVSSISRVGWKVAAKRDLKDFYIVVLATPQGNLAGEYYAKTDEGRKLQRWGKIQLFVSDRSFKQIVPDSNVFSLEQRMKYSAYVGSMMHGLYPANFSPFQPLPVGRQGGALFINSGWLIFHQGDLFMMPTGVKQFLFVFKGGKIDGDSVELAFTNWSRG